MDWSMIFSVAAITSSSVCLLLTMLGSSGPGPGRCSNRTRAGDSPKEIMRWSRDSDDLREIIEARAISRQAALNSLAGVISDKRRRGEI